MARSAKSRKRSLDAEYYLRKGPGPDRRKKRNRQRKQHAGYGGDRAESVKRIIQEVDADAGHAMDPERFNVGDAADKFAFDGRQRVNSLGDFQA